ncbi:nuclear transport factor 2 family protein [Pseudomonas silvicola]|uniref:nuclear transport factor 2 family protein n=1 Tax=Pseudomonas sp. RIT-To-2 TaxID=3462541 RepID=UPI00227C20F7|nr:nuclear transport factor 2 family protein [Pseudomonas silvicola]
MTDESTRQAATHLFTTLASGASPAQIAALFNENVDWYIAGDTATVPWIGRKTGRQGVAEFYGQVRELLNSERFQLTDILVSGTRAVAMGELASRVKRTGKLVETAFAFDLTIEGGLITRCHMLEDSFAVAQAAV